MPRSFAATGVLVGLLFAGCAAPVPRGEQSGFRNNALDASESESGTSLVTTGRVNVFKKPLPWATVIRELAPGTLVTSLGDSRDGFVHVEVAGDQGWAVAKLLKARPDDESSAGAGESPDVDATDADSTDDATDTDSGDGSDASLCVETINRYRKEAGLRPLARWTAKETCSDGEAESDAASKRAHGAFGTCGEVAQNECPGFPGQPADALPQCLQTMVDEGPGGGHYDNIFSTKYTKVACGFSVANGKVWAVQNFR